MEMAKIILGSIIGAIFTGLVLGVVAYFAAINDHSSSLLGPSSTWWELAVIGGVVLGLIVGGFSGAIVAGFNLSFLNAAFFGGVFNFLLLSVFYILTNGLASSSIKYSFYALIPIGIINTTIVSLFNSSQQSLT